MSRKYSEAFINRILQIELECNKIQRSNNLNKNSTTLKNANIIEIIENVFNEEPERTDLQFVEEHLIKRNFVFSDGTANHGSFFNAIGISESSYTKFRNGTQHINWSTALKLVLGLRLSEEEAKQYLSSIGYYFKIWDKRDILILAYIRKDYFGDQKINDISTFVYDMIECYNEMYQSSYMKPLKHLFTKK